ncbi:hypothetical protein B0H10DRAFT_2430459 [Mycena sp. CBHHK59/15]|nr:hypothetical protein B0H10DRAFT_2430459 [Mycena sp. CBHHK59/15]
MVNAELADVRLEHRTSNGGALSGSDSRRVLTMNRTTDAYPGARGDKAHCGAAPALVFPTLCSIMMKQRGGSGTRRVRAEAHRCGTDDPADTTLRDVDVVVGSVGPRTRGTLAPMGLCPRTPGIPKNCRCYILLIIPPSAPSPELGTHTLTRPLILDKLTAPAHADAH